jgi:hypothetical protein
MTSHSPENTPLEDNNLNTEKSLWTAIRVMEQRKILLKLTNTKMETIASEINELDIQISNLKIILQNLN